MKYSLPLADENSSRAEWAQKYLLTANPTIEFTRDCILQFFRMTLTNLPKELLLMLSSFLHNIEDFKNLSSTCRVLRENLSYTNPNTLLGLLAASAPTFVQPHPLFLVLATARQVSRWALQNEQNSRDLQQAFKGGFDALLELCLTKGGIIMAEIRRLHLCRFSDINPFSNMIDRCAGPTWAKTPNFWEGGVSDPVSDIDCEPVRATYQILIYGELFADDFEAVIYPSLNLPKHSTEMRFDYIRYCVPGSYMDMGYWGTPPMPAPERVGPYPISVNVFNESSGDAGSIDHILQSPRWKRTWKPVRRAIGEDFKQNGPQNEDQVCLLVLTTFSFHNQTDLCLVIKHHIISEQGRWRHHFPSPRIYGPQYGPYWEKVKPYWRQDLWQSAIEFSGLNGLEIIREGGIDKSTEKLERLKVAIEQLDEENRPKQFEWGMLRVLNYDFPHMARDIFVLIASRWMDANEIGGPDFWDHSLY